MKKQLARLGELLPRHLWTESEAYRARRRCRTMLATPFAAIGGIAWGVFSSDALGASRLFWGSLGGFSFAFLVYLEILLVPPLAALSERIWPRSGMLTALLWEGLVIGGLVFLLTSVLGAPPAPAIGTALGIGAAYTFVMEYVLCGSAAADITSLVWGSHGGGAPVRDRYTNAEALIHQARFDEAEAIYREAIASDPRAGAPYLGLARALTGKGAHEGALSALRSGLITADLPYEQAAFFVRQIAELCAVRLERPTEAIEDLDALLSLRAEGPHAEWARRELAYIEKGAEAESGLPAPQRPALNRGDDVERFELHTTSDIDPELALPFELDRPQVLNVEDGFRLEDQYDFGEELVLEEEMTRPDRYASAWGSSTEASGDTPSGSPDGGTPDDGSGLEDETGSATPPS